MSDFVERLAGCKEITEWVDRFDNRLAVATGRPAPNSGASARKDWDLGLPPDRVVAEVSRLLVPTHIKLSAPVCAEFNVDKRSEQPRNRVLLRFATEDDWLRCFPLGSSAELPRFDDDMPRRWAAVALCGKELGLAIFAQVANELTESDEVVNAGVEARVQPVPDAVFQRLIESAR